MIKAQTLIAEKGQSQRRPTAYLGALRPQPPENTTPTASVTSVLLLSNPINRL
jgi:hypothetical protein